MTTIASRVTSITFYVCSVLLVTTISLHAMQEPEISSGKIPSPGLMVMKLLPKGNNEILAHGELKDWGGNYVAVCSIPQSRVTNLYDSIGYIKQVFRFDDSHVILIPYNGFELTDKIEKDNIQRIKNSLAVHERTDDDENYVKMLNVTTGDFSNMFKIPHGDSSITQTDLLSGARFAMFTEDCYVEIWDYHSGTFHKSFMLDQYAECCVTTDRDNRIFWLRFDGTLLIWDVENQRCIETFNIPVAPSISNMFVIDENHIAFVYADGKIAIWDLESKTEILNFQAHNGYIDSIINLDADHIATGGRDQLVKTWSWRNGKCINIFSGHVGENGQDSDVRTLAAIPDDRIASGNSITIQVSNSISENAENNQSNLDQVNGVMSEGNTSCSLF